MVGVGEVGVMVDHRLVPVPMDVAAGGLVRAMMVMMLVMPVGVLVFLGMVMVVVLVALGQVQPDAATHQNRRRPAAA